VSRSTAANASRSGICGAACRRAPWVVMSKTACGAAFAQRAVSGEKSGVRDASNAVSALYKASRNSIEALRSFIAAPGACCHVAATCAASASSSKDVRRAQLSSAAGEVK
jgi:hypothetical protein